MKRLALLLCWLVSALPSHAGPPTRNRSFQFLDMGCGKRDGRHRIVAPIHGGTRLDIRLRARRRGITADEGLDMAERLDEVNRCLASVLEPPSEITIEVDRARRLADFAWEGNRIVGALPGGSSEDAFLAPLLREYGRAYFMHNLRLRGSCGKGAPEKKLELAGPYGILFGELLAEVFAPRSKGKEAARAPSTTAAGGATARERVVVGVGAQPLERERIRRLWVEVMDGTASSMGSARVAEAAFRALAEAAGRVATPGRRSPSRIDEQTLFRRIQHYLRLQ